MWNMNNADNTITDLPATVVSAEDFAALTPATDPAIGDSVVIYSRGRYRVARVTKVGPKRVTAEYTTPSAIARAFEVASISEVASTTARIANNRKQAQRYRALADMIDRLGIKPTEDTADSFVPLASLPAEYAKLDAETGSNLARTTIVWKPETLRRWADNHDADTLKADAGMDAARAHDARPLRDKARDAVVMTTKAVPRDAVKVAAS